MTPRKQTQLNAVKRILTEQGKISRNDCIDNRLTIRLGAYIEILRNDEGWKIAGKKSQNDFIYTLEEKPKVPEVKIVERIDSNGNITRIAVYN
jgi:hypothetical protein